MVPTLSITSVLGFFFVFWLFVCFNFHQSSPGWEMVSICCFWFLSKLYPQHWGLELTTLRSSIECSTKKASQGPLHLLFKFAFFWLLRSLSTSSCLLAILVSYPVSYLPFPWNWFVLKIQFRESEFRGSHEDQYLQTPLHHSMESFCRSQAPTFSNLLLPRCHWYNPCGPSTDIGLPALRQKVITHNTQKQRLTEL